MSKPLEVAAEAHAFPAAFLQSHLTVDGKTATAYNARGAPHDGAQNATNCHYSSSEYSFIIINF